MNNVFINKELFSYHFAKEHKSRRLHDFGKLYTILKTHLKPTEKLTVDKKLTAKYINAHNRENRKHVELMIKSVIRVSFDDFYKCLLNQVKHFNSACPDKYILVVGIGADHGASLDDFSIYKSNIWTMLLCWKYIKKPIDILLSLTTARMLYPTINDYCMIDDMCYTGSQLIQHTIGSFAPFLQHEKGDYIHASIASGPCVKIVNDKLLNIHLIVPYMSNIAATKINNINLTTCINVTIYSYFYIKSYGTIMPEDSLNVLAKIFMNFKEKYDFRNYLPIMFDHKIADSISTIEIVLIKGVVLDNPNKKIVFVKNCMGIVDYSHDKTYCPIPPYVKYKSVIEKILHK